VSSRGASVLHDETKATDDAQSATQNAKDGQRAIDFMWEV